MDHDHPSGLNLGINAWLSSNLTNERVIERASKLGFKGIEFPGFPTELDSARRKAIKGMLLERGLGAISVSSALAFYVKPKSLNLHSADRTIRKATIRYTKECIDLASGLGAGLVYVASVVQGRSQHKAGALDALADSLGQCADYAERAGVKLALEHFPGGEIPSLLDALEFVSSKHLGNIGLILDTGHLKIAREDLAESLFKSRNLLAHVHINNNDGKRDLHWSPQRGSITAQEFAKFFRILNEIQYGKYVSLELAGVDSGQDLRNSRDFLLRHLETRD